MAKRNLLEETIDQIIQEHKSVEEVVWVGIVNGPFRGHENAYCSWTEFAEIAKDINYNAGFGTVQVCPDLVVCGEDWWLERCEYDGSEWWEFKTLPTKPKEYSPEKVKEQIQ